MRNLFATELHKHMEENESIWILSGGVGFGVLDKIQKDFPTRFLDCESSEQAMVDIAVGLALSGKVPFVYAITPHLYRAFEGVRLYLDHEKIPVHLVGVGRGKDYGPLGFTHFAEDDARVFGVFENIVKFWPQTKEELPEIIKKIIEEKKPSYLNLQRE